jgi:sigma-54 dependent transcriptional regulator, acetoin dehydrogenase operon transcriptional activator AcoR
MLAPSWKARFSFDDILGESEPLRQVLWLGRRAADGGYPTLIVGESGTGKELLAHAIHSASPQSDGPFVAINCGTLSAELAVAELCGYEPGAFTGADRHLRTGLLDAASGGTLFLDELQDMAPGPQSVLLRVLETQSFVRVGGTQPVGVSVRVLATLNIAVEDAERRGLVRSDLLYRLNCLTIDIPPLRDRREDIRPIAEKTLREELHFLGEVTDEFWSALETCPHPWPGNARGLRNALLKAILASTSGRLVADDLPGALWTQRAVVTAPAPRPAPNGEAAEDMAALRAVLRANRNNISAAARRLGIHRSTVYRRLARNGEREPQES